MSEWLPIESAPKGDETILVYDPMDGVCSAFRMSGGSNWITFPAREGELLTPTHWMPLPAPPQKGTT